MSLFVEFSTVKRVMRLMYTVALSADSNLSYSLPVQLSFLFLTKAIYMAYFNAGLLTMAIVPYVNIKR